MQIVVIDPRQTASCDIADLHLALRPGSDAALFCGALKEMELRGKLDGDFLQHHTQGAEATLQAVQDWTVSKTAAFCDLSVEQLLAFYQLIERSDRLVTLYSMGINQSSSGVDKCNAIINLHLATGKIAREGCGPFSITGQPNAMGAVRLVGWRINWHRIWGLRPPISTESAGSGTVIASRNPPDLTLFPCSRQSKKGGLKPYG